MVPVIAVVNCAQMMACLEIRLAAMIQFEPIHHCWSRRDRRRKVYGSNRLPKRGGRRTSRLSEASGCRCNRACCVFGDVTGVSPEY